MISHAARTAPLTQPSIASIGHLWCPLPCGERGEARLDQTKTSTGEAVI